jgi:hypothetical protein
MYFFAILFLILFVNFNSIVYIYIYDFFFNHSKIRYGYDGQILRLQILCNRENINSTKHLIQVS